MLDVLAISPHPDDVELAMGGSLLKFKAEGLRTGLLCLTNGEPTPHGTPEKRLAEAKKAAELLELDFHQILGYTNRFLEDTREARIEIASIIRCERPRIVFLPYWIDAHPDHVAAYHLGVASVFTSRLTKIDIPCDPHRPHRFYHYYAIHLRMHISPAFVLDVSDTFERKIDAMYAYESQFSPDKPGAQIAEYIKHMGRYWGSRIGTTYGEPFFSHEVVGLTSMRDLT